METKYIFIDTSTYMGSGFRLDTKKWKKLRDAAEHEEVKLLITDITKKEIYSNIEKTTYEAFSALTKFKGSAKTIWNVASDELVKIFFNISSKQVISATKEAFEDFWRITNSGNINPYNVASQDIFEDYFSKSPPFGSGKKKSEFPDAFVLSALENWAKENNQKIYVISSDGDMKNGCEEKENLTSLRNIDEILDLLSSVSSYQHLIVKRRIDSNMKKIKDEISEYYPDDFFYIEDQNGDVDSVTVDDVEINSIYVQSIDELFASISMNIKIKYTAEVTYDDPEMSIWDSEDKKLIVLEKIYTDLQRTETCDVTFDIEYDMNDEQMFEISNIEFEASRSITIDETEYY